MEAAGFYVDVGEKDNFHIEVEGYVRYDLLYTSPSSVVCKAYRSDDSVAILRVNWSDRKRVSDTRGRVAAEICYAVVKTPRIINRQLYQFGGKYVMVTMRDYIDGTPASEIWHMMSPGEREDVASSVCRAVMRMSSFTSQTFGKIQDGALRTSCPVSYLNHHLVMSKLRREVRPDDVTLMSTDTFSCKAVLCHRRLTLDHIILKEGKLSGIVGWSAADYVPEIFDRMWYYFRSRPDDEGSWEMNMSMVPVVHGVTPFKYAVKCVDYHFSVCCRSQPSVLTPYLCDIRRQALSSPMVLAGYAVPLKIASDVTSLGNHTGTQGQPVTEDPGDSVSVSEFDFDETCTEVLGSLLDIETVRSSS